MSKIKSRDEIKDEYKWDLKKVFKDEEEFNNFLNETKTIIDEFKKYKDHVMDNANSFYNTLTKDLEISRRIEKMYSYSSMLSDEDISNNKNQELVSRVLNIYDYASQNTYFFQTELLKEDYSKIEQYIKDNKKLEEYKSYIKKIYRYKEHTLSDIEEKLLSKMSKAFGNQDTTYSYLTDSDLKFDKIKDDNNELVELTDTNYSLFIRSKNRNIRKDSFEKLYSKYKEFKNTLASTLDAHIKENVTLSHIKKYNTAFDKSLFHDELDEKVYNCLKDTVHENISVLNDYYKMKKEILGLKELHMYDIYCDLLKDYDKEYSFDEAKEIVFKALKPLGKTYLKDLEKAFTEKWIDIYPNKNKRGGAYSGGSYDTHPYVLLNYQNDLNDVSTIIHELGHSMHSYYTRTNQPYQYGDYPIFVAEVASTTNELLLSDYLIKNSNSKEEKLQALNHLLELFKGTIYRQTMFEEFEKFSYDLIEKDDVITSDKLCDKYYELNYFYYGKEVINDELIKYEWERVPHFYYNFYVYKYATSLSAACMIATNIINGDTKARDNYLEMLKSGSRLSPLETLKIAGVDMTKKEVYENAIKMFKETIEEFKKVYKEK